jgi:cytoskeletal protein RodZ
MVFAKSTTSNLSKIYTPITLNVLEKYIKPEDKNDKDEYKDKDDSSSSIIIILVSIIVILIVVIGIFVFIKIKKSKNKINIYDNKNSSTINEMNILTPDFKSDDESIDKPGVNKPINKPKPNYLNPLIEDEENQLPNESDITKETTPDPELKRVGTGINLEDAPPII